MKKNNLTIILVLVLSLSLFTVATVAASTTDEGYEKFKDIMSEVQHEKVGSGEFTFTITDNGTVVLNGVVEATGNEADKTMSGNVTLTSEDAEAILSFYGLDDTVYVIDQSNDGYYKFTEGQNSYEDYEDYDHYGRDNYDHKMTPVEEEILDYFVGDLKDNFIVVENADGSTDLSFSMRDSEVPTILNLMAKAGAAAEHRSDDEYEDYHEDLPFMSDFDHEDLTDLVEDVQIDEVSINVSLDESKNVTALSFKAAVSGKDTNGEFHQMTVSFSGSFDASQSEVDVIDVDAYDWETIENDHEVRNHRRK